MSGAQDAPILQDMQTWLERAVIGLNLCPFAKAVQVKGLIHWVVSPAVQEGDVLAVLTSELQALASLALDVRETTVLVLPAAWPEFLEMHAFLPRAERCLRQLGYEGQFQIAPFHPGFEFFDAPPQDMGHFVNRAPYPALHLLREASITRAVEAFPEAETIYERNLAVLRQMGLPGWQALDVGPHP
jgi:hypothetical protein